MNRKADTTDSRAMPERFFPIRLDAVDEHTASLDLFLWHDRTATPVLYRARGVPFTERDRRSLLENGISCLYAPLEQHAIFRQLLVERLERLFEAMTKRSARHGTAVRHACAEAIEDVMRSPASPEPVRALCDIGERLAQWAHRDRAGFERLVDLGTHDYATSSHMVNVGVGCGLLARELKPDDDQFTVDCIVGGLLHDLGKRGVPESVLMKEGRLGEHEWRLIRRHPTIAFDELSGHHLLSEIALEMIRDHHERMDGTGYPRGMRGEDLSLAARVCAVVDAYDAIAAQRPYRSGIDPQATLALMSDGAGAIFDEPVLRTWTGLIKRLLRQDPTGVSLGAMNDCAVLPSLHQLLPRPAGHGGTEPGEIVSSIGMDDRRRFPRHTCRAPLRAMFLRQGKPCPVLPGELFNLETLDVAKGGLLAQADWPFSLGDVLVIFLPQGSTRTLRLHAHVVRVRRRDEEQWAIGVRFIAETDLIRDGVLGLSVGTRRAS